MTDWIQICVLSFVAISCGLLSPFLVLKRMTMFANSLSHTILLGIAMAFLLFGGAFFDLPNLLIGAFLAALMTALFTEGLVRLFRLQEDASIGLVFTFLFALGILVVSYFMKNVHLGLDAVMGNADLLQWSDLKMPLGLTLLNFGVVTLLYNRLQLVSFDQNLARTLGINGGRFHFLLLFLTAAVCVASFRAVGVLIVLAFLTGPFLIARLFFHRLSHLLIATPLIGVAAAITAVGASRLCLDLFDLPLSTGGMAAVLLGLTKLISSNRPSNLVS